MEYSINEYQPPQSRSRFTPQPQYDPYIELEDLDRPRESRATSRSRASTPSAAVRRAMQVLDETYQRQSYLKQDRWSHSADQGSYRPIKSRRSPSPINCRSRSPSPIRSSSPNMWTPPRLIEIERDNFQDALDDSESRREILLKKLADAQKTMEFQNERLREGELDVNEAKTTVRLLQQVQQELETKTQFLEKDRRNFLERSKKDAEDREIIRRKMDEGSREASRLRCQLDLLLADKKQHHVTLDHLNKTIKDLRDETKGAQELQSNTAKDLDTVQERLNISRQKGELLEKEKNHAFTELEKTQKAQQALINRNTDLGQRLSRCQTDLQDLSERYDRNANDLGHCKEELELCRDKLVKQSKDLADLRRSHAEMQQDRERALRYNEELEKTVQSIKLINQDLKSAKVVCEDEMTDLHADLAKVRLQLSKVSEESANNGERAKAAMKECEKLSTELNLLRPRAEELAERVKYFEGMHNMDVQQISMLQTQRNQINREKEDLSTRLASQEESYEQLQNHHEEECKKLNKDLGDVRRERDKLSTQVGETEAHLTRVNDELTSSTQHNQAKIEHWRQACSKLTSLVEEKEEDLRKGALHRRDLGEKLALAEAERRNIEMQMNEMQATEEELVQLRTSTKKLSQECAENQQMIAVLEMQRDILAKSPSKASTHDSMLKSQVEKLQAEITLLKSQLTKAESEKKDWLQHKMNSSSFSNHGDTSDEMARTKGVNQLLAEQLTEARQRVEKLHTIIEEKDLAREKDVRKLEREKQHLDLQLASMADELKALRNAGPMRIYEDGADLRNLRSEIVKLKQDVEEKKHQVMVLEGERVILENGRKRAEDKVDVLEENLAELKKEKRILEAKNGSSSSSMQDDVDRLTADVKIRNAKLEAAKAENAALRAQLREFDGAHSSQEDMIGALKRQLESHASTTEDSDAVGSDAPQAESRDIKALKRELRSAQEAAAIRDNQLVDLKNKLVECQRMEQRTRQERDELQGKTIIMESLSESSRDLLKELDGVRSEKEELEMQLSVFASSKTSQTPPTSLSLVEDLDLEKELERQYSTVCERNKWLETRIASLQREIDLVRDQNSLLQEQRNNAEREASKLREEMKDVQMRSKGSRRKNEVEQIHLQHSNAEKMQQILDLEREVREKTQIIQAMAREMESLQKKSDKSKISNFMKKLKKGSDTSSSRDLNRSTTLRTGSADGDTLWSTRSGFGLTTLDTGYSSSPSQQVKKRSASLSPKARSASFDGSSKVRRNSAHPPSSRKGSARSVPPTSPTLTYVTAFDDVSTEYVPSPNSEKRGAEQTERRLSGNRVSFDESSDPESATPQARHSVTPSPRQSGQRGSPSGGQADSDESDDSGRDGDNVVFISDDFVTEDQIPSTRGQPLSGRSAGTPIPAMGEPQPTEAAKLPSPASSPSLPSPTSSRKRSLPVYVTAASDESEIDHESRSEDSDQDGGNRELHSPPTLVKSTFQELTVPATDDRRRKSMSPLPRPQSQPNLKGFAVLPSPVAARKKHSSLV